jgi:hypothetical protein
MAFGNHDQIEIQKHDGQGFEIQHAGKPDHAQAELVQMLSNAERRERFEPLGQRFVFAQALSQKAGGAAERRSRKKHRHRAENPAQYERHRRAAREGRGEHADGQQAGSREPIAQKGAQEHAKARIGIERKHRPKPGGKDQSHRVNRDHREVLADEDLDIVAGQREEQFIRALLSLLGPDCHRDGRDNEQQ